jgi:protein TonB
MRQEGVAGIVVALCVIDAQGNVAEVTVEKASNQAFAAPAVEALKKWKFKPAQQDGVAVAKKVSIPIKFSAES